MFALCTNKISTYPIQCIIGQLETEEEKTLFFNELNKYIPKLAFDVYASSCTTNSILFTIFSLDFSSPCFF